jgi:hypothetical protein
MSATVKKSGIAERKKAVDTAREALAMAEANRKIARAVVSDEKFLLLNEDHQRPARLDLSRAERICKSRESDYKIALARYNDATGL